MRSILPASVLFISLIIFTSGNRKQEPRFVSYTADLQKEKIELFWKDEVGTKYKSLNNLDRQLAAKKRKVVFAMNSGMYTPQGNPVGLYIEKGKKLSSLKKCNSSKANFCLQPQAVFYVTASNKAGIATVNSFNPAGVQYAAQSAPMLVQNGIVNKNLPKGYQMNRNGVGIKKNDQVVLAIGYDVNFHQFAAWFKAQGCTDAMFFDGGVSEVFYPAAKEVTHEAWAGAFGGMIAVIKK